MDRFRTESWTWRAIYAATLLMVLGAFLFEVRSILNPFILSALVILLASPFTGAVGHVVIVIAVVVLATLWLLGTMGSLLAPFFLALGFGYLLYPLARRIERRGVSRGAAVAILSLPMLGLIALAIFVGIPALAGQLSNLVTGMPAALQSLSAWLESAQARVSRNDWPYVDEAALLERLRTLEPETVLQYLQGRQNEIARRVWAGVMGAGRGLGFVLTVLGYLFLTPILTFYLLRDWEKITSNAISMVPVSARDRVVAFFREYDRLLAGYLRGTLTQSTIVGILTSVLLWILGIPFALLLGVMAAVFNIIPYVGLILTAIPALVVALFTDNIMLSLGKVVAVFVTVQLLDGAVIGPRVLGGSVGLHPVLVILALSVAGFFWGFLGLLLAVPLAVLTKLLIAAGVRRYRHSELFLHEDG